MALLLGNKSAQKFIQSAPAGQVSGYHPLYRFEVDEMNAVGNIIGIARPTEIRSLVENSSIASSRCGGRSSSFKGIEGGSLFLRDIGQFSDS